MQQMILIKSSPRNFESARFDWVGESARNARGPRDLRGGALSGLSNVIWRATLPGAEGPGYDMPALPGLEGSALTGQPRLTPDASR